MTTFEQRSFRKDYTQNKNHPSITSINKHMANSKLTFTFQSVTKNWSSKLINLKR